MLYCTIINKIKVLQLTIPVLMTRVDWDSSKLVQSVHPVALSYWEKRSDWRRYFPVAKLQKTKPNNKTNNELKFLKCLILTNILKEPVGITGEWCPRISQSESVSNRLHHKPYNTTSYCLSKRKPYLWSFFTPDWAKLYIDLNVSWIKMKYVVLFLESKKRNSLSNVG